MPNIWTINNVLGGSSTRTDLVGCHIKENDAGTAYELTDQNVNVVLATTSGGSLPTPPFSFQNFGLDGYTWTVNVNTLTGGPSGNRAEGTWFNDAPNPTNAEGTYTAQAGAGLDADEDREAAASA